jgi:outer membrane protein assembly factor BamC
MTCGFLSAVILVSGCSSLKDTLGGQNSIDYSSVKRTDPLSVPPDLTQAAADPRYRAPATGSTTFSQFQAQTKDGKPVAGMGQPQVLPSYPDMEVKRDGDLRWLNVKLSPDQLYPKIVDFWVNNGFSLAVNDPKAGIMVTNWAENRAKIPESWLRQALGSVLDTIYDSGTRDKFRTIIERDGQNTTVYISHQHMNEVQYGVDKTSVKWENGREDPGLNAAMLARLMVALGEGVEDARKKMAQAQLDEQKPAVTNNIGATATLSIAEPFDKAWRRVGVALDSGNFAVDDRDRSKGDFFVRYVDTDTGIKREEPSALSRFFFGKKDPQVAQLYRLNLVQEGNNTIVKVFDANNKQDTSETAKRILTVLSGQM